MEILQDVRIESYSQIPPPRVYREDIQVSQDSKNLVIESRKIVSDILHGKDERMRLITGPCSIHDVDAGIEYAKKLSGLKERLKNNGMMTVWLSEDSLHLPIKIEQHTSLGTMLKKLKSVIH